MGGVQHGGIHSETAGDPANPLVVLIHGSMDRGAGLLRLSRRLDHDHHVLRYDRRGYYTNYDRHHDGRRYDDGRRSWRHDDDNDDQD